MAFKIVFKPAARRDLKKLPSKTQERVLTGITVLSQNPRKPGVEKLRGYENMFRFRVGDYRIIFQVHEAELIVLVVRIGNRKEIYHFITKSEK